MAVEVILPKVDMDMASAKILKWFVGAGEHVKKGAALFEIETDKAAMEIESPADGFLQQVVKEGEIADIGSAVGFIMAEGEAPSAAAITKAEARGPEPAVSSPAPSVSITASSAISIGLRATPLARRLARKAGLDIKALEGSGPHGRIVAEDVRIVSETKPGPAAIASSVQQFSLSVSCDIASLASLSERAAMNGRDFDQASFVAKCAARAAECANTAYQQIDIIDLGTYGIEQGTTIVTPPYAMALVMGAAADGRMNMTLCATQAVEHTKAAALLKHLREFIEDPMLMLA
jgi:pyruvate/2-oxoglutarate dehydrogenase complex dihydrolipoamide acyltransferase (E2) component